MNAGTPPTLRAPITEIVDFKDYDDAQATSTEGQSFEITLISGHKLKFSLKKSGTAFVSAKAPTFANASMGAVDTYKPPTTVFPALYSTTESTSATFTFANIQVLQPDGVTLAPGWNIIIIDAESTNNNTEDIIITTNGEAWTSWDLITNTTDNPREEGIGTATVKWTGTTRGITGAYAAATIKPGEIEAVLRGSKQGIALAIQSYIGDKITEACSGSAFDATPNEIVPSSEMTYTWLKPVILGDEGAESLDGGSAQTTPLPNITQTLINNTNSEATATFTITPHHKSGTALAPFTLTVTVNPLPTVTANASKLIVCAGTEVTLTGGGAATYTWNNGVTDGVAFIPTATTTYTVTGTDANGCVNTETVTVTVNPLPTVTATASLLVVCAGTEVTLTGGGAVSYTWDNGVTDGASFVPTATATYSVTGTDANGCVNTETITVTVNPCPPVATDDQFTGSEEVQISGSVATNDLDPKGHVLTFIELTQPANGVLTFNPDGTFTFVPNTDWDGITTFEYQACDPAGLCDNATVTITVTPVNDAPVALDDVYSTTEDTPITIAAPGILVNDSDVDGDAITAIQLSDPANGTVIFNADGSFTYTPNANFNGTDSFTYQVTDGALESNVATVTITVTPVNDAPVAVDDSFTTTEDTPVSGSVATNDLDPDGDPLTYTPITQPENGTLIFNPDGSFTFTPDPDWSGTTEFDYEVCDDQGACVTGTVTIIITPVNDAPVVVDDSFTTPEDTPVAGSVGTNDLDPEGGPLTYTPITQPENGTLIFNPDGSFIFTPNPDWSGTTDFDYEVCDAQGACVTGTGTVIVTPINDSPIAEDDSFTTPEDTPVAGSVGTNDFDPEGSLLTYTPITKPENGTMIFNPDGSFIFTPDPGWNGTTEFEYEVCDTGGLCERATAIITVTPVNDAPLTVNDHFNIVGGKPFDNTVALNDLDPENDPLTYTIVSEPEHGQVTLNPDGTFTYSPDDQFFGSDQFVYRACDPSGACDEATVTFTTRPLATISLTPSTSRIAEGDQVSITAVLSEPFAEDVEIILEYSGDAQNGKDYQLTENFATITIPAGQTTTTEFFMLSALIDGLKEKDEHAVVTITAVSSNSVKIGTGAEVLIVDIYPPASDLNEDANPDLKPDPLMSPNDDGQGNDYFKIGNIEAFPGNEVIVFNRWGNEVYRVRDYDNASRSFRGIANTGILTNSNKNLPDGVYYFVINTLDADDNKKLNKGYLILKR